MVCGQTWKEKNDNQIGKIMPYSMVDDTVCVLVVSELTDCLNVMERAFCVFFFDFVEILFWCTWLRNARTTSCREIMLISPCYFFTCAC